MDSPNDYKRGKLVKYFGQLGVVVKSDIKTVDILWVFPESSFPDPLTYNFDNYFLSTVEVLA